MENRVERYKTYRQDLQKSDEVSFSTPEKPQNENRESLFTNTTSSLPLEQVMGTISEQNKEETAFTKKRKKEKMIKYSIFIGAGVVVITVLIILLVLAIGGK